MSGAVRVTGVHRGGARKSHPPTHPSIRIRCVSAYRWPRRENDRIYNDKKFRNQKKLSADGNINSTGFLFENDVFALPNVIGFTANEMVLVYNPYEIASYVDGQTILKFKFSEVQEYLKLNL